LPFITLPIFTRILTTGDYGILALAQVYAALVCSVANFGMTAAYERNFFQYRNDLRKTAQLLYSTVGFVLLNFLVLACLTYFLKEILAKYIIGSEKYSRILMWACFANFFEGISFYYLTFFKNSGQAKKFVSYTIADSFLNFIIALILIAYFRIGIIGIVFAQLCSGVIIFSVLNFKFSKSFVVGVNKNIFYNSLKIAYPLAPRIFFGVIGSQYDKFMVGRLASLGGAGIYSIGQKISYMIFTFMTAIENVFMPEVYKRMFDLGSKGGKAVGEYLTPWAYISIFPALLRALFSEEVIHILAPS
jgi:O-antigen/teichoic acid export membrane protein